MLHCLTSDFYNRTRRYIHSSLFLFLNDCFTNQEGLTSLGTNFSAVVSVCFETREGEVTGFGSEMCIFTA